MTLEVLNRPRLIVVLLFPMGRVVFSSSFMKEMSAAEKWSECCWEEGEINESFVTMDQSIKELLQGKVRQAKLLITEINMVTAIKSLVIGDMDEKMMKSLRQQVKFLDAENPYQLGHKDMHPSLWNTAVNSPH